MNTEPSLEQFGSAWLGLIKDQAKLAALESRLAQVSLFPLLLSGLAMALFIFSLWMVLVVTMGVGFAALGLAILPTLLCLIGVHLVLILIAVQLLLRYKKRMGFHRTRASLREML